jgi:hypothetical protein
MDNKPITEEKQPYRSFGWPFWIFLAAIVFLIYGFARPRVIEGCGKSAVVVEATSNARQIGLALHEFEKKYGAFPNDQTKFEFDKGYVHKVHVEGTSSNALFRQLIASGIASEQIFYAKAANTRKPDNEITRGRALLKGEVAFAYVAGLSSNSDPTTPVAFCPIITVTDRFDPKPFKGRAVILRADNSVSWFTIRKDGHVYDKGINLLSSKHPIWKGKAPVIHYPE